MRLRLAVAAIVMLSACEAKPKSKPWVITVGPGDSVPRPVVSPDNSVRRSRPDEVVTGRAPLRSECEGDACGAVTVTWLGPGYRFENTGSRAVAIKIWFAAKGDCLLSKFTIAPSKNSGWGNVGFCKPYSARYE